jgi:hypothetical protein
MSEDNKIRLEGQLNMLRNPHDYFKEIMGYDKISPEARYLWMTMFLLEGSDVSFNDIVEFTGASDKKGWSFPTAKKYRDELEEIGLLSKEREADSGEFIYKLYLPKDKVEDIELSDKHREIFNKWNEAARKDGSKVLPQHRKLTSDMKRYMDKRLKQHSLSKITRAIENYATVVEGKEFFWDYVWTLSEFLGRTKEGRDNVERFSDMEFVERNFIEKSWVIEKYNKFNEYSTPPTEWSDETWREMADDWEKEKEETINRYKRVNKLYKKYYA